MPLPPPTERVLIVDDDPVMRDVLSRFLRRAGFEVLEVGSVVAALDELMAAAHNDKPFEHAVVDLVLKDGDGEDVVRACESLSPRPNIIVLSGNIDSRRALDL
jgi:DNA-binding response OmpR family regulator